MTKKASNFTKNICYSLIISICAFLIINHSVYASNWSNNHKKAVKNECKIAVKNGEYLTQKECKFHKYSIVNSYGYADAARLQDSELERIVKLKCTIYIKKTVFEYNQCVETYVNKQLGIERLPDPEKPKEIIIDPEEPSQIVEVPTTKKADDIYEELKKKVVFVESWSYRGDFNSSDKYWDAYDKARSEGLVSTGSAVLIKKNIFATNCHVISTETSGRLSEWPINDIIDVIDVSSKTSDEDRVYIASYLYGNQKKDVCLIKIYGKDYNAEPAKIKKSMNVNIFDNVYALGNPGGNVATFSRGEITGETENFQYFGYPLYEEDAIIFQHNAPIERGNSGGGLFDENGYLIAINSAGDPETLDNKDLIPHNYAISIDEFMKVLDLDE